jgi:hypothetical protein
MWVAKWKAAPPAIEAQWGNPAIEAQWGKLSIRRLIFATDDFIVFIDDQLDIDWKTTSAWDHSYPKDQAKYSLILNPVSGTQQMNGRRSICEDKSARRLHAVWKTIT